MSFTRAVEEDARARGLLAPGADAGAGDGAALDAERRGDARDRGWWAAPRRQVLVNLAGRACSETASVWVVFDGNGSAPTSPSDRVDRAAGDAANYRADYPARDPARDPAKDRAEDQAGGQAKGEHPPPSAARVIFTPSADDWIVRAVKQQEEQYKQGQGARQLQQAQRQSITDETTETLRTIVVTADRPLAGRSRHHGAEIVNPSDFVSRCLGLPPRG